MQEFLLIQGDAKRLPLADASVPLIVTSPNYNAAATESAKGHPNASRGAHYANRGYDGCTDDEPEHVYQAGQLMALGEIARVLKPGGALCYVHKDRLDGGKLISPLSWLLHAPAPLVLRQVVVIDRGATHNHSGYYYAPVHEYVFILTHGIAHRHLGSAATYGSVWRIPRESSPAFEHPAPYHPEIPRRCIEAFSAPGDTVLDCYAGTNTTGHVALQLGRRYIGVDTSARYLLASVARLSAFQRPLALAGAA